MFPMYAGFYVFPVRLGMFLFCCFLLVAVFIFAWYLSLCLHLDLSKISWYVVTDWLKISSEEDNDESQDSIDNGTCLMIDGEWLDSVFMYFIFFDYFLFGTDDKLNGVTSK